MNNNICQVFFVGAGPGDPELITVKGQKCIQQADLVLYAGSLVPRELINYARKDAKVLDSSGMNLEETHLAIVKTVRAGGMAVRVHTGDPSLYGAIKEQMFLLDRDGISYQIIPGVTVAFAAAAAAKLSFTLPGKNQSLVFTRLEGRTPVPEKENIRDFARHQTSMAIYLSTANPQGVVNELIAGGYPEKTPAVIAYRVGWPDELIIRTDLGSIPNSIQKADIHKQAVFLILPDQDDDPIFSKLYNKNFTHGYRK